MRKVMTEVMEGHITNERRFRFGRCCFELLKPLVNGSLPKSPSIEFSLWNRDRFSLRCEYVLAFSCSSSSLKILIKWLSRGIQQNNVSVLLAFMTDMEFADLPSHLGMLHQQEGNIAHSTSSPV